jgi:HNH endonuclease
MRAGRSLFTHTKLNEETGCWEWTGRKEVNGYGYRKFFGKKTGIHRVSAHLYLGLPLDSKLFVLHKCDNRACANPKHLFVGNQKDNIADMVAKGRHASSKKLNCLRGHPLSGENLRIGTGGGRKCFACAKVRHKESPQGH